MVAWISPAVLISFLASCKSSHYSNDDNVECIRKSHQLQPAVVSSPLAVAAAATTATQRRRRRRTMAASFTTPEATTTTTASVPRQQQQQQKQQPKPSVNWIIRPATVHDRDGCAALIQASFATMLAADYSEACLRNCLPLITTPRQQLLTCHTWYVAEHPGTRQIVGCGGWTVRQRPPRVTVAAAAATVTATADNNDDVRSNKNETTTASINPSTNASASIIDPLPKATAPDTDAPKTAAAAVTSSQQQQQQQQPLVPQLRHFAVHPAYARMGIASLLWKRTHEDIQRQFAAEHLPFPVLEVYSTLTAESFYATACGFVRVKRVEIPLLGSSSCNHKNNKSEDDDDSCCVFSTIFMRREPPPA